MTNKLVKMLCLIYNLELEPKIQDAITDLFFDLIKLEEISEREHSMLLKRGVDLYHQCKNPKLKTMMKYEGVIDFLFFSEIGHINKEIFNHFKDKINVEHMIKHNKNLNEDMKDVIEEISLLKEII